MYYVITKDSNGTVTRFKEHLDVLDAYMDAAQVDLRYAGFPSVKTVVREFANSKAAASHYGLSDG